MDRPASVDAADCLVPVDEVVAGEAAALLVWLSGHAAGLGRLGAPGSRLASDAGRNPLPTPLIAR